MSLKSAKERLQERQHRLDVQAKRSLGQNFLISDSVIEKILKAAWDLKPASVLEIGPGLGALTDGLRRNHPDLTLLELDSKLAAYWKSEGTHVIETDALQWDWDLSPFKRSCVLVSNLPYQISSSLVVDRSVDEQPLDAMILMFQKEVAQRIKADIKHEAYGFLSVIAQTFWKVSLLLEASPRDFSPAPKVASRVLVFETKPSPVRNKKRYLKFLKACFLHPRKFLLSNLAEGWGLEKEKIKEIFEKSGFDPKIRADQLSPQKLLELYRGFEG